MKTLSDKDVLTAFRSSYWEARKVVVACPICEGVDYQRLPTGGDRHGLGLTVSVCRYCGLSQVSPRPGEQWYSEFYQSYFWPTYIGHRFKDLDDMYAQDQCVERAGQVLDAVLPSLMRAPDSYLDIGCGQGGMLAQFKLRCPTANVVGVEPSKVGAEYCKKKHDLNVMNGEWHELGARGLGQRFDFVTAIHVLEHVLEPVRFLESILPHLSADGTLYVEVPNLLSSSWSGSEFFHVAHQFYLTPDSLIRLCARAGLDVIDVHHGATDIWPWAVGVLARKAVSGKLAVSEVVPVGRREIANISAHVRRGVAQTRTTRKWKVRRALWAVGRLGRDTQVRNQAARS